MMPLITTALSLLLVFGPNTPNQVGRLWTFADLLEKSHVAIIGRVTATVDTGRKVAHPGLKPRFPAVEMETEFEILLVLKGETDKSVYAGTRLVLHHYRQDSEQWRADNPTEPGKPPRGSVNTGSVLTFTVSPEPYILFLVRTAKGLEPVSGHTFPTESVFLLRKQAR